MNLNVEPFLEDAFESVKQTSDKIGRVIVEPNYDADISAQDAPDLAKQLQECLRDVTAPPSPQGLEIRIPEHLALLTKYLRQITLHADKIEGPWVEVAPPGNWI